MNRNRIIAGLFLFCLAASTASAAELGRRPLGSAAVPDKPVPGGDGVPVIKTYNTSLADYRGGIDLCLEWTAVNWDIGSGSYSALCWTPQVGFSLAINRIFDLRFTGKLCAATDGDTDIQFFRTGVGTRASIPTGGDFFPYAGASVNFYSFNATRNDDDIRNLTGTIGIGGEMGMALLINDNMLLRMGMQAEATLADAEAEDDDGRDASIGISAVGLDFGMIILF